MFGPGQDQQQAQMIEMVPEDHPHDDAAWYTSPTIIGPVGGAIIIAILGPVLMFWLRGRRRHKRLEARK